MLAYVLKFMLTLPKMQKTVLQYSTESNLNCSKYSLIRNEFGAHGIERVGPIHDLLK